MLAVAVLWAPTVQAGEVDAKIVNGDEEDGFPSAVALGAYWGEDAFSACSGNLVTPALILTAGHCGAELPLETVVEYGRVFFGTDISDPDGVYELSDAEVHPDYEALESGWGGDLGSHDFGVLVLDTDADAQPTWFRTEEITEEHIGTLMTSVGYGVTSSDGYGSGVKRSAQLELDELDDMFLVANTTEDDSQICSGDSGGPQFVQAADGRWIQWAVHSWGDQYCSYTSGSTRTDLVGEWLLDKVEEVHGTRDLCDTNGHYGDGTCDTFCEDVDPDCVEEEDERRLLGCACSSSSTGTASVPWLAMVLTILGVRRRERMEPSRQG